MNKKGQALVEFVLIMPVILFTLLAIFDFGNVLYQKYTLENDLDTVASMYEEGMSVDGYINKLDAKVSFVEDDNYNEIIISKKVRIITPILSNIIGKNYDITVKKTVIKEKVDDISEE